MSLPAPRFRRVLVIGLAFAVAVISCGRELTGPNSALRYAGGFAWNAIFPEVLNQVGGSSSGVVPFTRVRVLLRHADGSVALDTTIDFPAGATTVPLTLTVQLAASAPASGEVLALNLAYINAAGDTVFKGGPTAITAAPTVPGAPPPTPVSIPVTYTGTGSAATSVLISTHALSVNSGGSFALTATASGPSGVIPNTPMVWTSSDATRATISSPGSGSGTVSNNRGTVKIIAQLLTGPADTATLTILPVAQSIALVSGNTQTGVAGASLANPVIVLVKATDGLPMSGVPVTFAAANGGSVGATTVTTDVNGNAQTTWKLGSLAGAQTLTAAAAGLTGSPVNFSATAAPAPVSKLVITTQPSATVLAASALTPIVVTAQDANGNTSTAFTGAVTMAFGVNTPAATLTGTATVNAVAGIATFSTLTVSKIGTGFTLVASATGVTSATTTPFNVLVGPAATIALASGGGQTATAGSALPLPIVVKVTDAGGNAVPGKSVTFATASGTVSPLTANSDTLGNASTTWTLGATAGPQTMTVTATGLAGSPVTIGATATSTVAGPATQLVFTTGPSNAVAGVGNSPAIVVQARDAGGLLATTFTGNVTLTVGTNPGASALGGGLVIAAVGGVATFPTNITLNHTGVGYTLIASSGVLTPGTSPTFNITAATAMNFAKTAGDGQTGSASALLAAPLTVKVTDAFGNGVPGSSVSFAITTGGGSLGTTVAITDAAGQATSAWTLGATIGAQSVTATSTGLTGSPLVFTATAVAANLRTWTGATSTAWTTASNWSPAIVPAATDSVVIVPVTNQPLLVSATTVKALTINPGASLVGSATITVNGALNANGSLTGSGGVVLASATPSTVQGVTGAYFQVTGTYVVTGTLSANSLQVMNSGSVDINGQAVSIAGGGISTASTATITMTQSGSTLITTGGAAFGGGDETGKLTAGTLTVASNFFEGGGNIAAFNAGAGFSLILNGAIATNFSITDPATSPLGNLIINDAAGVTALTQFQTNNLTLTAGILSGTLGASITGTLTDPLAHWAAGNISFSGSTTPVSASTPSITPAGQITFNNNPSILAGNLTVTGTVNVQGNLQLNGHTLTINGNFATSSNGQLTMNNAADVVTVTGDATFGSTGAGGPMSLGTMNVGGNFTQSGGVQALSAFGTNTIVLNGAGAQVVNFGSPDLNYTAGCASSCFNNLTINKSTGSTSFTSPVKVLGAYVNSGVAPVAAPATNGSFIVVGNATFGQNAVYHRMGVGTSTYSKSGLTTVDSVSYFGAAQTYSPAALAEGYSDIRGTVNWSSAGTHTGEMVLSGGGQLNVSTSGAIVTGNFTVNGSSTLKMTTNASDSLKIGGNAVFAGGSTDGLLTAGYLIVSGNFDMGLGSLLNYSSTAGHTTVLAGGSTQSILLSSPIAGKGFYDVWMRGAGNKQLNNAIVYAHDVNIGASVTTGITSNFTWTLSGHLTDSSAVAGGAWRPNATNFTALPNKLPRKMNGNVSFQAGALVLADTLYVGALSNSGAAQVSLAGASTSLDINGFKLQIDTLVGVFSTQSGATLIMTHAADKLKASDFTFFGGQSNQLTSGTISVYGNFQQGTNATAFQATSPHSVWLKEKNVLRGITFANPGFAASHFGDLYDSDTLNVLLNSDIYADGQLQTGIVSQHQFSSSNKLITSKGADVRDLWLTNTRWLLTDGYSISDMDAIQFQSMTSTGTQLEVQRTNAYSSVNFTNINFQTTPTGVGLYLKVTDTNGATNGLLNVTMSGTTPASSGGFTQTAGGATITGWSNVANWTGGAASTAWNTAANWDFNAVPTSATDVVIGTSIYQPQTGGAVTVHSLTVNSGATLTVTGANMTVNGDIVVQPTGKIDLNTSNVGVIAFGNVMTDTAGNTGVTTCAGPSSAALNLQAGTHTVTGKFCNLSNFGTYTVSGPLVTVGSGGTGGLQNGNGGSLNFNGHRVDAVTFANGGTGTIIMQNAVDSLFIHGGAATFSGGSETGLMTAGAIIDRGPTLTGTGTGFDASGGSQMLMVDTTFAQGLNWTTPVVGHGFNNVTLKGASGKTINGDPYITGTLLFDVSMTSGTVGGGSANIYVGDLIDNSTIVGGAFNFAGNLHIKGNPGGSFPATLNVNTLSFESGGNFVMQNNLLTHAIVVDSGSGLIPNGHWVNTQGLSLTTQNGGVLGMTTLGDSITVGAGSVYFNGGSTSGQLTMGAIVAASIFQGYINTTTLATGTSATSFAPSGTHRVWMPAGASGRIIFANPGTGATGSHFNSLRNVSSDTTSIYSDIFVDDSLYLDVSGLNFTADVTSSAANHRLITTQGLGNNPGTNPVTFNNVSLKWVDGQTAPIYFQQVTWTGFPALFTGNVFEIARISGGSSTLLGGHSFSAVVASGLAGGEYLNNTGTLPWLFNGLAGIGPVILLTGGTHSP